MKFVESAPRRYERLMNILTFGNYNKTHDLLINEIKPGSLVLDVGCGTGRLSLKCARLGAKIHAVDSSIHMISMFKKRPEYKKNKKNITIHECGCASMKQVLGDMKFDIIVYSFLLGELSEGIRIKTLQKAGEMLKKKGFILIADELWPKNKLLSMVYNILFVLLFIPNFLLTRTLIKPAKKIYANLEAAGLKIENKKSLGCGIISILKIKK